MTALVLLASVPLAVCGSWVGFLGVRSFVSTILAGITENGFGLCSGTCGNPQSVAVLSDGIHGHLQTLAGKPYEQPLTFGDLWNPFDPDQLSRVLPQSVVTPSDSVGTQPGSRFFHLPAA